MQEESLSRAAWRQSKTVKPTEPKEEKISLGRKGSQQCQMLWGGQESKDSDILSLPRLLRMQTILSKQTVNIRENVSITPKGCTVVPKKNPVEEFMTLIQNSVFLDRKRLQVGKQWGNKETSNSRQNVYHVQNTIQGRCPGLPNKTQGLCMFTSPSMSLFRTTDLLLKTKISWGKKTSSGFRWGQLIVQYLRPRYLSWRKWHGNVSNSSALIQQTTTVKLRLSETFRMVSVSEKGTVQRVDEDLRATQL